MNLPTEVTVALVAGAFGLVPIIVQWLTTKAQRRDRNSRLNTLQAELEFLERVSAFHEKANAGDNSTQIQPRMRVDNAISDIFDRYNELSKTVPSVTATSTVSAGRSSVEQLSFFRRMLLLYTPETMLGWVWHSLFYVVLLITIAFTVPDFFPPYDTDLLIGSFIIFVLFLGPLLFMFQRLARRQVT